MDFELAKADILDYIHKHLGNPLNYHCYDHVIDVYESAKHIAQEERIGEEDTKLLLTAAICHDIGFIESSINHEEKSCVYTQKVLPNYNYSQSQINCILGMIMATKTPQSPKNLLEQILCDADLDYLGRTDFKQIGSKLYRELKHLGNLLSEEEWNKMQIEFLKSHTYFTKTSIRLREKGKQENLEKLILKK